LATSVVAERVGERVRCFMMNARCTDFGPPRPTVRQRTHGRSPENARRAPPQRIGCELAKFLLKRERHGMSVEFSY
jgi:hypothetical protein